MKRFLSILAAVVAALIVAVPAIAADFVWTTAEVDATRFVEADSGSVGTIESGQRVEVLFKEGDRLRVKLPATSKFGWIDAGQTSETDPAATPEEAPAPEGEPAPDAGEPDAQ